MRAARAAQPKPQCAEIVDHSSLLFFLTVGQFVAQRILAINEFGTYSTSFPDTEAGAAQKLEQDEEIFNRARLVNCGYFMQIILGGAPTTMDSLAMLNLILARLRRCDLGAGPGSK